jgi:hypothetical protein
VASALVPVALQMVWRSRLEHVGHRILRARTHAQHLGMRFCMKPTTSIGVDRHRSPSTLQAIGKENRALGT